MRDTMKKRKPQNRNETLAFLKTFLAAFLIILVVATPIFAKVGGFLELTPGGDDTPVLAEEIDFEILIPTDSPFFDAFTNTSRINILALGVERNNLTDTIMLFSFDVNNKFIDIISIPRDTYYYRGYADKANNKINAVYRGDPVNTALAVSEILMNIPINYYALMKYEGVANIVNEIGGVPMNIPFHMKYTDLYDKPPLYIDIPKGEQVLYGEQAVQFLRFRQADDGYQGYPDMDFGRIRAQQEFLKSAAKECIGLDFPNIVRTAFDNVESDISIRTALYLAGKAIGIDAENIKTYQLPVRGGNIQPDKEKIAEMLTEIYSLEAIGGEEEEEGEED